MPLAVVGWFGMNNLLTGSPNISTRGARQDHPVSTALVVSAIGLYLYLPVSGRRACGRRMDHAAAGHPSARCDGMKFASGDEDQSRQAVRDLPNKHTWSMTALYVVTFGSFIGFDGAAAVDHGDLRQHPRARSGHPGLGAKNPNAPSALMFAWIGPFCRRVDPSGGRLDLDKVGLIVTQWISDRARDRLRGDRLRDVPPTTGDAGTVFFMRSWRCSWAFRGSRHRQMARPSVPGVFVFDKDERGPCWADLCGGGLRPSSPGGDRRQMLPARPSTRCTVLPCVLRPVRGPQLVVLPADAYIQNPDSPPDRRIPFFNQTFTDRA